MFPAHAGVILTTVVETEEERSVPRACGGDPRVFKRLLQVLQCSPRMRG